MNPRRRRAPFQPALDPLETRQLLVHASTALANIVYTSNPSDPQRLDVLLPPGPAPASGWPVVLAIHGGGWYRYNNKEYEARVAPALNAAGFAVVAPNYTLAAPGHPSWPAPLVELREAVAWTRSHASALGLDPTRVAAMGESAGGHLAALLGTETPDDPTRRVDAVVDFYGPTDLPALFRDSPRAAPRVSALLGGPPANRPAAYADASPVDHASPSSAPTLIIQGRADPLVPPSQSVELAAALARSGVPATLVTIPRAGHGFGLRAPGRNLTPTVVGFLRDALARATGMIASPLSPPPGVLN